MAEITTWRNHTTAPGAKYRITWNVSNSPRELFLVSGNANFLAEWRKLFQVSQRFRILEQSYEETKSGFLVGSISKIYWVIEALDRGPMGEFFSDTYVLKFEPFLGSSFQLSVVESLSGVPYEAKPDSGEVDKPGIVETVSKTVDYLKWIVPLLLVAVIAWSVSKIIA